MADIPLRNTAAASDTTLTPEGRRAVTAAFFGFFVDMFDVYLPVVALTPALIYFQPKNLPAATATTIFYIVFAVTLVGRPIGAFIFGHLGDRIGRRRTTLISVFGFGVVTLLIALLPGYRSLGFAALVLLILMRLLDGIFLGGEYTAASPLAMEYCPPGRRGFFSALVQSGYPVAYVVISLATLVTLRFLPAGGLNSPYVQWGWRIPFVVGAILAFVLWSYFRGVSESEAWEQAEKTESPLRALLFGRGRAALLQVFVMMTGFWLALNAVVSTLPIFLKSAGMSATRVTYVLAIANIVLWFGYMVAGVLGQRIGRRTMLTALGVLTAVVCSVLYVLLIQNLKVQGIIATTVEAAVIVTIAVCGWGQLSAYISERFPVDFRSSGFGVGYSLAAIVPAFYSFVMLWMGHFMPYKYAHIPLLVLSGLLIAAGALAGPETNHVDLAEEATMAEPAADRARRPELA